ncbi:hypothetical protein CCP1ISM_8140001 [Azospirillaceae bacterium]
MSKTNTAIQCWVKEGSTSSVSAATNDYCLPANVRRIFEVLPGVNDYISGVNKRGTYGSLCILKMRND